MKKKRKSFLIKFFGIAIVVILILVVLIDRLDLFRSKKQNQIAPNKLQCAENLPTDFLAGQVLMIGLNSKDLDSQADLFSRYQVGGAVLMTSPSNPYDGSIIKFKNNAATKNVPILISTDEEGGQVQRFASLGQLPSPRAVADTLTPNRAQKIIAEHGLKLKKIGIDMILGPLADVAPQKGVSVLGNRIFSSNPSKVIDYAKAYVDGWKSAGLISVLKHFPGLGSASGNTDFQSSTTPPLNALKQRDFLPYQALVGSSVAVMIGNQNVPGWFQGPASLSLEPISYLRNNLGYKSALVITDSLGAKAITSSITIPKAAVEAIVAGNDIALIVLTDQSKASNQKIIVQSEHAIEKAVMEGFIPKSRLAEAVERKLNAQGISACSITK